MKSGHKQTEVGTIPDEWQVVPFLSAVQIANGQVDPRVEPYRSMILIAPDHIESGSGRLIQERTASAQAAISGKYLFDSGDIVYSKIRPYLRKATIARFQGLCSADMYPLKTRKGVESGFILPVILGHRFSIFAEGVSARTGIPKINREDLSAFSIALPPQNEQRAIATALSDVDALLSSLDALIAKKRDIKQAAMQQLLTGKTRLPGFKGEWEVRKVGEFTDCTAGGTPSTLRDDFWGGDIRWMNSGELNLRRVYEVEGRITEAGLINSSTKLIPPGCVLIGLAGQGRTRGTVAINYVELCTNQSIAAVFPNSSFSTEYLYQNLDSRYEELRGLSSGGGGRGGLNLTLIKGLDIPFPSIAEQTAIAEVLSDMGAELAALEARRDKTRLLKQGMMQELLTGKTRLV